MTILNSTEMTSRATANGWRKALIVTAIPIEMKAVRAHIQQLGSCPGHDGTVYECGQFTGRGSEWLIVVAESGAGTHPAQSVVTDAHRAFGDFELLLFVGVGASRKPEVAIGSVVASSYVCMPYGGKFYRSGFASRPQVLTVDPRLVGLARKVQRDEGWSLRICVPLNGQLPSPDDYPQPYPPTAIVAPIVSVEAVSADPDSELERQITLHYDDALALEMEGYGVVFAANRERTPAVIVRGISDMRTGKAPELDALHQPVAAAHAAAFAFEMLDLWSQLYRPERMSPPGAAPSQEAPTEVSSASDQRTTTLVLTFDGSVEDFPPEKINEVLNALRQLTGNPSIRVVGAEPGSFHLLVEARPADLECLQGNELRESLLVNQGVTLQNVAEEPEFRESERFKQSLRRASRHLLDWRRTLPDGHWIDRPELKALLRAVFDTEDSVTALIGDPGSGKTALLAAFGAKLLEHQVPCLGIKADVLDPSVQTERDLQDHLGLDCLPSELILRIARFQPVVLLIDQLDALASYVDLRTGRLSLLLNLVRKIGDCRNIHVVISARTFEYEHDVRLKTVQADSLTLELPSWSVVLPLLEAEGIKADGWPPDAQDLMRLPQALATFLQLRDKETLPPFPTYQAMLEQLWKERILRRPDGSRLSALATAIAQTMAEKETLWLAAARYDTQAADLDALVANGIMTRQRAADGSIGFSHQMVFTHILARAFAQQEGRLSTYVLERQDSLFIRPKVWAALTYLRQVEPATYAVELKAIWSYEALRVHVRRLLIEFLGQWTTPTDGEVLLIEEAIRASHRTIVFQSVAGSPGWFERLARSYVGPAMAESPTVAQSTVSILMRAWAFAPDQVVSMIRECWLGNPEFDGLTWAVLQGCEDWTDEIVRIATLVLQRTDISQFALDHTVATVGVTQPDSALALVLARLEYQLAMATNEVERRRAVPKPTDPENQLGWALDHSPKAPVRDLLERNQGWESLEALAERHPGHFLETIFPWFRKVFALYRRLEDDRPAWGFPVDFVADFRFEGEYSAHQLPEPALLGALRVAAEVYAAHEEPGFLVWLDANEHEAAVPAQRLFAHALASQPRRYASRALAFLVGNSNRLHLGTMEDNFGTTKRLVRAVSAFWSAEELYAFEAEVLGYAPSPSSELAADSRKYFYRLLRKLRLELLSQLPEGRTSTAAKQLIREEGRRFKDSRVGARFSGVQTVGSPIKATGFAKARDREILNAFRALPDSTGWDHPKDWHLGGNIQLSREFSKFAKDEPERAAHLIRKFEPSFGTRAAGYALDAMAESADPALILELIRTLHERGFDGEEFRTSAARAIERLLKRDVAIDDDVVAVLEGWLQARPATEPDDESGDADDVSELDSELTDANSEAEESEEDRSRSILWTGSSISVVPQGTFPVLEALTRIFLSRGEHDRLLVMLRQHLTRTESPEVWRSLLRFLIYLRPENLDDLADFLAAVFEKYPELVRSEEAAYLLAHAHWNIPEFVHGILTQWENSRDPWLLQAYGELVALIVVLQPELEWPGALLSRIMQDDAFARARTGVAYSAVNLWNEPIRRTTAADLLIAIIPKADQRTWIAVFDIFRLTDEITPQRDWVSLLETLADNLSKARGVTSSFAVQRLQTLLPHEALLIGRIARNLLANWREELSDSRTATAAIAPELVDLAITLHRLGPETRNIGSSLFEDLLEIDAYTAQPTLNEIDHRFMETRPRRPRLPRRRVRRRSRGHGA